MIKRVAVLLVLALALVRCWSPDEDDPMCHGIKAVTSGGFVVDCPSGATQFCASTPIAATSSVNAHGACDACFGAGTCQLTIGACGPEGVSWEGTLPEPNRPTASRTEFQFGKSALVSAGDISSGPVSSPGCTARSRWAP